MKITLPFRLNYRFFFAKSIGRIGVIGGVSGKCVWLHFIDSRKPDFIAEKESIDAFYYLKKRCK